MPSEPGSGADHHNNAEVGFTLVELLIVVVILGVLAAIVVFAVGNVSSSTTSRACASEMTTFETAVQVYRSQHAGALPAGATTAAVATSLVTANFLTSATLGFNGAGASQWSYTVATGAVTAGASCN